MKGKKVVEVMSGIGRHLPIYLEAEPQLVVMVDMNAEALKQVKTHNKKTKVEKIAKPLMEWINEESRNFRVLIAMWCLCYMDLEDIRAF